MAWILLRCLLWTLLRSIIFSKFPKNWLVLLRSVTYFKRGFGEAETNFSSSLETLSTAPYARDWSCRMIWLRYWIFNTKCVLCLVIWIEMSFYPSFRTSVRTQQRKRVTLLYRSPSPRWIWPLRTSQGGIWRILGFLEVYRDEGEGSRGFRGSVWERGTLLLAVVLFFSHRPRSG
jgi:hypothetical protein